MNLLLSTLEWFNWGKIKEKPIKFLQGNQEN
jgi:hypothetical protein